MLALAMVATLLTASCADANRVAALERAQRARDENTLRVAEESGRMAKQVELLAQRNQQLAEAMERMAGTVASLRERLAQQDQPAVEPQRRERTDRTAAAPRRRNAGDPARPETYPECAWLGKRAISVLLNDDPIAADGFTRMYTELARAAHRRLLEAAG
jgi:hypothetical protein